MDRTHYLHIQMRLKGIKELCQRFFFGTKLRIGSLAQLCQNPRSDLDLTRRSHTSASPRLPAW